MWAAALAFTLSRSPRSTSGSSRESYPAEVLANRIVWALLLVTIRPDVAIALVVARPALRSRAGDGELRRQRPAALGQLDDLHLGGLERPRRRGEPGLLHHPLVNVGLGFFLLGERPRRAQWIALAIAAAGVVWLTASAGRLPWIGLVLGLSFGAYGLLRRSQRSARSKA